MDGDDKKQAIGEDGSPHAMAERFKNTFSRNGVKVHFLGVWYASAFPVVSTHTSHTVCVENRDTVSSIGVFRGKSLPYTDEFNNHICYFRHALALDERRVKFLPEYICGGESYSDDNDRAKSSSTSNPVSAYFKEVCCV
jgi:uncharacterized protein (DUF2235 family)